VYNPAPGGGSSSTLIFIIGNPTPVLSTLDPSSTTAGSPGFSLSVTGNNFVPGAVIRWNGSDLSTNQLNTNQLNAYIDANHLATAGIVNITVFNTTSGGVESAPLHFTIKNPAPTLSSLSSTSILAGSNGFVLTVTGTNFVPASVIRWNGIDLATNRINNTQLSASIDASKIAIVGTVNVSIFNPTPGGGSSTALTFTINNPAPVINGLNPSSASSSDIGFTLIITGSGFVPNSVIRWNSTDLVSTWLSNSRISTNVTSDLISTAGTFNVTVFNPGPGGGESSSLTFTVNSATPTITNVNPSSITAGDSGFTLVITGSNFVAGSVIRWNGQSLATTWNKNSNISANIDAKLVSQAGIINITVSNPDPGGGESAAQAFTINNPIPTLSSLNPLSVNAGDDSFILTVTGTNFISTSVISWNNVNMTTTWISTTQLSTNIKTDKIVSAGIAKVGVINPGPGGGTSSEVTFTINAPQDQLSKLDPASTIAGSSAFTLTVSGSHFDASSVIRWNGKDLPTKFISDKLLTAEVGQDLIADIGSVYVTVYYPAPKNYETLPLTFSIDNPVPVITELSPSSANAGNPAFLLTVNGSNFINGSMILWNGTTLTTTWISSTQLTINIDSSLIANAGNVIVTVVNTSSGGDESTTFPFIINKP
jgi:hypothetical protein